MSLTDEHFMRLALAEAAKGVGLTSPNPAVGAVLVQGEKVIATGYHSAAGKPHAELECLRALGGPVPETATLYVTLEPCSSAGRTPPCTNALIAAGVQTVVAGATDPNPKHAGRGFEELRRAGVEVQSGVLANECTSLNEGYNKWIRTGRPFVIAKCGMSLDGRLTRPPGESRWITSLASRRHAHALRTQVDAILVGAETVRADNPRLTVRDRAGAQQPWRVVLTRSGKLPTDAHLFTDQYAEKTLVFRDETLPEVMAKLGEMDVTSVLIEGGGNIFGQALDARLIDRVRIYIAPMLTGGNAVAFPGKGAASTLDGLRLRDLHYEKIGNDVLMSGTLSS